MGLRGCSETSVRNIHYTLRNSPEERSFHLPRGGILDSRMFFNLVDETSQKPSIFPNSTVKISNLAQFNALTRCLFVCLNVRKEQSKFQIIFFLIMMHRIRYIWQENHDYMFKEKRSMSTKIHGVSSQNNLNITVVRILSVIDIHCWSISASNGTLYIRKIIQARWSTAAHQTMQLNINTARASPGISLLPPVYNGQ